VRLEPFAPELKEEVRAAVDCDPGAWAIMPVNPMGHGFESFWTSTCGAPLEQRMAYAIRRRPDARVVGMSSFLMISASQRSVEIGGTFLHPEARSGFVNPAAKMLMLDYIFRCGAIRVQFNIDARNVRSQAAVAKLGAVREGVLRRNRITWTGYVRDTVVFSILFAEWPAVSAGLEARLGGWS
jgi:RimJ/RimL family protein N-acetyltransferase